MRLTRGNILFSRFWILVEGETDAFLCEELARLLGLVGSVRLGRLLRGVFSYWCGQVDKVIVFFCRNSAALGAADFGCLGLAGETVTKR